MNASAELPVVRRRWQFGLRTLLIATAGVAVFCGAHAGTFGPVQPMLNGAVILVVVSFATLAIFLTLHALIAAIVLSPMRTCLLAARYLLLRWSGRGNEW